MNGVNYTKNTGVIYFRRTAPLTYCYESHSLRIFTYINARSLVWLRGLGWELTTVIPKPVTVQQVLCIRRLDIHNCGIFKFGKSIISEYGNKLRLYLSLSISNRITVKFIHVSTLSQIKNIFRKWRTRPTHRSLFIKWV